MMAGLPCTGKTTIRKKLMKKLEGYDFHDNTQVRKEFGYKKFDPRRDHFVLKEVDRRTELSFKNNKGVILDSIHRFNHRRKELYEIADKLGVKILIIECICSAKESKKRLRNRPKTEGIVGDVRDTKIYDRLSKEWEDIKKDLGEDYAKHVSYTKFDSEKNNFERIKVDPELINIVEKIEKII